jgi:FixJ family two-component response regulator
MSESDAIVFVVDDNAPVREAVTGLLKSVGLRVETFASAQGFLAAERPDAPACLVLDVRLPGLSGLDLQRASDKVLALPYQSIAAHTKV